MPVSLAILSAFSLSAFNTIMGEGDVDFDSVAMFTFLLLVGRFVELSSRQRYERSRLLAESLMPASARDAESGERVDVTTVVPGLLVRILPGETITADGTVISGRTTVNEAAFTGESVPLDKGEGERVVAGTINLDGEIVVRGECALG
ncbi:MAG: hypothetical protein U5O39_08820 [Gammaproteobacteria bacterium]|nr:hypothetical protein [Gammaproteobacteria bacterium]